MWRFLDGPIVVIVMYRVGTIYGTLPDNIILAVSYSGVTILFFQLKASCTCVWVSAHWRAMTENSCNTDIAMTSLITGSCGTIQASNVLCRVFLDGTSQLDKIWELSHPFLFRTTNFRLERENINNCLQRMLFEIYIRTPFRWSLSSLEITNS